MAPIPVPPKRGRVKAFYVSREYRPENDVEMPLEEGDMIFVEECGQDEEYFNVINGDRKGKLSAKYVNDQQNSVVTVEFPMHEAAKRGNVDLVGECLKNGISVNSLDKSGSTALYWAALNGHVNVIEELLKQPNVSISAQNKLGDTPLHAASRKGHVDCATILIERGACVYVVNRDGQKPIHLAKSPELAALLKLTMDKQPDPNVANEYASLCRGRRLNTRLSFRVVDIIVALPLCLFVRALRLYISFLPFTTHSFCRHITLIPT
ncbi:SH3 domain-containing protein [Aphelenchoides fujianensis]|nr:SH3 domain-containing protein [Aphelenchoides fujianensis]